MKNIFLVIEEGNWLNLHETLEDLKGEGFDAIICMGNSFAHLPDFAGENQDQKKAIDNFHKLLKPGGIMVIDHRNYDFILQHGYAPKKNIYYNVISCISPYLQFVIELNF